MTLSPTRPQLLALATGFYHARRSALEDHGLALNEVDEYLSRTGVDADDPEADAGEILVNIDDMLYDDLETSLDRLQQAGMIDRALRQLALDTFRAELAA